MGLIQELQKKAQKAIIGRAQATIQEQLEDSFGPNPCDQLKLQHMETGEVISLTCDSKRCIHCGPRKQAIIWLQAQAMGPSAYYGILHSKVELDRALERAKKEKQRHGIDFTYMVTGDESLGFQVISTVRLWIGQQWTKLARVKNAVLNAYHLASARIRRSQALGSVSVVPTSPRATGGTRDRSSGKPTLWARYEAPAPAFSLAALWQPPPEAHI